jgi:Ulp1 family protease
VYQERGSIILAPSDTRRLLTFGSLLNDHVVLGYLNLLAVKLKRLGIPVRIVAPQFYPTLLEQGWTKVQRWVKEIGFMETNWLTSPIILVPIFTGSIYSGHWSGYTVDRSIPIGPTGIRVYKDSLSSKFASNALKASLSSTPLVQDTSIWVGNSRHSSTGTWKQRLCCLDVLWFHRISECNCKRNSSCTWNRCR